MHFPKLYWLLGAFYGLAGVSLGAFGAHALDAQLQALDTKAVWETAVDYQMWHALALLVLAWSPKASRRLSAVGACFGVGILLFSGSLYWLALEGPRWLGPITPIGGLLFIVGWLLLMAAAFERESR